MNRIVIVLALVVASVTCLAGDKGDVGGSAAEVRSWTSTKGQKLEATFVKMQGGYVYLRTAEARDVMIALVELTPADREVARRLSAPPRPKPTVRSYAGKYSGTYRSEGWSGTLECELSDDGKDEMSAAWAAMHSDKKTYKYSGALKRQSDGRYDGVFDVRRPNEFRVNGSFDAGTFSGSIPMLEKDGTEKKTGELSMTRKSSE